MGDDLRAKVEERVFALLTGMTKIKNDAQGRAAIFDAVKAVLPVDCLVEARATPDGMMVRWSIPITGVVTAGPPCSPMQPCGCYGCGICNGAQAPLYGYGALAPGVTPVLGVPVVAAGDPNPCTRSTPCGHHDCTKCFPGQGLPRDQWGRKKPGGSKRPKETGYRVLPYGDWLNAPEGEKPGTPFSTPDLATQHARKSAKAAGETYLVLREGARWKLLKKDGDEIVVG